MTKPGKVAIITAGSAGIGAGLAAAYRARGWSVVASAHAIVPAQGPDLVTVAADMTEPAAGALIVDAALERFGRIDTLVNHAGVFIAKPFTDYTAEDYALMVGVNLTGFFWLTQRVIAEMTTRYGGHVVTVTAPCAENSGELAVLAALTRAGLTAATRSLAVEYASYGIRVNAVSPGQVSQVIDAVLHLESSPHITGKILRLDGGPSGGH
jgi:NAD(P)-dependent dehydrogenase (short-subunit alcohol dehydrogenase family)